MIPRVGGRDAAVLVHQWPSQDQTIAVCGDIGQVSAQPAKRRPLDGDNDGSFRSVSRRKDGEETDGRKEWTG